MKTFLEINFLSFFHRYYPLATPREDEDQFHKLQGQGLFPQEMTNKIETQFQCRHFQEGRRL